MYSLLSENKYHDFSTNNKNWINYIDYYVTNQDVGNKPSIERLEFNLLIHNKSLIGVNPWDEDLPGEIQYDILQEIRVNPVYLFREVIKDENNNHLRLNNAVMDIIYYLSMGKNLILDIPLYSQYNALIDASLLYMIIHRHFKYREDIVTLSNIKEGGHIKVPPFVEKILTLLDKFGVIEDIEKCEVTKGNVIMHIHEPKHSFEFSRNFSTFLKFSYSHDNNDCNFHYILSRFNDGCTLAEDICNGREIKYDLIELEINMDDAFNAFINYIKNKYDYGKLRIPDKIILFSKYVLKSNYYGLDTLDKLEVNKIFGTLYSKLSQ